MLHTKLTYRGPSANNEGCLSIETNLGIKGGIQATSCRVSRQQRNSCGCESQRNRRSFAVADLRGNLEIIQGIQKKVAVEPRTITLTVPMSESAIVFKAYC